MKRYIIYGLALWLALTSCNDWLDVKPDTQVETDKMLSTHQGFKDALTGCYIKMKDRKIYGENLTMSYIESAAHLWCMDEKLATQSRHVQHRALMAGEWENAEVKQMVKEMYLAMYNVIVQANTIIMNVDRNSACFEDSVSFGIVKGEAYAIRAYCHLDILRLFGQMPKNPQRQVSLPYSEVASVKEFPPYYDYAGFVAKLESDLLTAEKVLEKVDPVLDEEQGMDYDKHDDNLLNYRRMFLNYYAVKALQARFYLYTQQPEKAYAAAKTLYGKMALSGTDDLVKNYFGCPSECFFLLSNNQLIDYSKEVLGAGFSGMMDWSLFVSESMLNDLFVSCMTSNRYRSQWDRSRTTSKGEMCPVLKKYYYNEEMKYSDAELLTKLQVVPMLRMSEIYLILMETTQDLAEANRLYQEYMISHEINDASAFASLDEVKAEVVNEMRREFYGEGQMFYTYKRLGTSQMMWSETPATEKNYIWPLPDSEFDASIGDR